MSQLTIYKASAGSGKTFRLVTEYLKLLIESPVNYRHILAVTFTNKATAEMKERILRDLNKVANGERQILDKLKEETGYGEHKIIAHAGLALAGILHDYDRFAVSTIDSFFQRVLRSFAREAGLYGAYEVELDQNAVLEEACDRLLLSCEHDVPLRNWLIDMSESQLNEGKNWQFRDNILKLGEQLMKEPYQKLMVSRLSPEAERDKLNNLRQQVAKTNSWFEAQVTGFGQKALEIISVNQLQTSDFKGGKNSFTNYFTYWANGRADKIEPSLTARKAVDNPDEWFTKTSTNKARIVACYECGLNQVLKDTIEFIDKNQPLYITAVRIGKNIYSLGVLTALADKVREVGREKNALLLSEGNTLLTGIIGSNDAPFIYEKVGSYYHFFMIDEFQDTSHTQWDNFRPLVANSLAENNLNLVVGDIKQSIYRWRNSDWQLLDKTLKQDMGRFKVEEEALDSNWRSSENVVEFNNHFFDKAKEIIQNSYNNILGQNESLEEYRETIMNAFADVQQKVASRKKGGLVNCTFIDKENYNDETLEHLIGAIESVQDKGYEAGDIAVLVKTNAEGKMVAEALLNHKKLNTKHNFEVISDDTLYIRTSASVRFLIAMMRYLVAPFDKVVQATVVHEFAANLLPYLEEANALPHRFSHPGQQTLSFTDEKQSTYISSTVKEEYFPFIDNEKMKHLVSAWGNRTVSDLTGELIARYHIDRLPGEQANVQAFSDVVGDFSKREGGSLHKFIDWWEQNGQKIKLQTAGQRNAIRIMTIHKSKGLEFPIVMLPFCDWGFAPDSKKSIVLWCPTQGTPFDQFPVLPINYVNDLKQSLFSKEYFTELLLSYIDNLNLLYVAMTRAENALYLFTESVEKDTTLTVNVLLNKLVAENQFNLIGLKQVSEKVFEVGELNVNGKTKPNTTNEVNLSGSYSRKSSLHGSLSLRNNYEGFLDGSSSALMTGVNLGKLMHELLSGINCVADTETAINKLLIKGLISESDVPQLRGEISGFISNPKAKHWFDGSMDILNESTILSPGYSLSRPDRVMVQGNKAIVVDYKHSDVLSTSHKMQVESYRGLLLSMGYQAVEGYVWYLKTNRLIDIDLWETN